MKNFKTILKFGILALSVASCSTGGEICVTGQITNAEDSVLYLENIGIESVECVDSAVLSKDGKFTFDFNMPDGTVGPEFYRLRIDNQIINLCVDSTESIKVSADYKTMATDYSIEGNEDCQTLKELTMLQMDLQRRIVSITKDETLSAAAENDSIMNVLEAHKKFVTMNYIFKNPYSASSYFALFQTIGGYLIFNPDNNKDDIKVFAAVATSWDTYYPGSRRGENLHNITIEGMKNTRILNKKDTTAIDPSIIEECGVINISLPDNKGVVRNLTDLKGKVVLLQFNVFNTQDSPALVMKLRDIYNKYNGRGLEIYQVSLDSSEHLWKTSTAKLPWINVRDEDGEYSRFAGYYNIQSADDVYLIDRTNTIHSRNSLETVEKEIEKII